MTDLQKYKKNEKNKENLIKHRACIAILMVINILCNGKTRLQIATKGLCTLRRTVIPENRLPECNADDDRGAARNPGRLFYFVAM